jgi:intracellular sulfur oxidation DsrE/DsrF family protein
MFRILMPLFALALATAGVPAFAASTDPSAPVSIAAPTADPSAPAARKLTCVSSTEGESTAVDAMRTANNDEGKVQPSAAVSKVVFQLNTADDAPTILRFVTNYLAVEPTALVAVVGYAGGIDFMLLGARDPSGKPYADQMAALAARGVAFKACNNTLKARNLTAAAVSPPAIVVPGAVNEIIRLQTKEGYAYFQN